MIKRRRTWPLVIIIIIFTVFVLGFLVSKVFVINDNPINPFVFTDINAFSKLDIYVIRDANDTKIGDLRYSDSYCKVISYEGEQFEVYAYVFGDAADAQAYFTKATGKNQGVIWDFLMSGNYFSHTDCVVYYQNYLYRVKGNSYLNTAAFINWMNSDFPINLWQEE